VGHHRFIEPYLVLRVELDARSGKPTKDLANYRRRPVQCRQHPDARPIGTTSLNGNDGGAAFADARSVSPARPRAFCAGMKATF
jgi:hypothetical protein